MSSDRDMLRVIHDAVAMQALRESADAGQITLGELAALLDAAPDIPVVLRSANLGGVQRPGEYNSFRGYYDHIALGTGDSDVTAHALAAQTRAAIGATFMGYKGGEFTMSRATPVWYADVGDGNGYRIVDVVVRGDCIELVSTQECGDAE